MGKTGRATPFRAEKANPGRDMCTPDEEVIGMDTIVKPIGLEQNCIYLINVKALEDDTGHNYDLTRLAVCMQGLVNRGFEQHRVAVALDMDATDDFWLKYIMGKGRTYEGMNIVKLDTRQELLDAFTPFLKEYGIIEWDPAVPSTANVASTICGLESCIPVQYSTCENSAYHLLTKVMGIPVKQSLVGMFDGKAGTKITGTDIDSTGSAKNDAYLWAMEKYMDRCNTELLAYTLDGATAVPTNPLHKWKDAYNAQITGIPNHDYFISKQCFFFDLTSYGAEPPLDDRTQPLGTDAATMKKILQKRYDLAGGTFGMVLGFPPWHVKYTNFCGDDNALDPPRLEWHFVEVCTSHNCGIEADAANPCWMSNGSLYTNYKRIFPVTPNAPAKKKTFDPNTRYFTFTWAGDYDCSPWYKSRAALTWTDKGVGSVPFIFSVNVNLVDRIPMAFDIMYENRTENDYIIAAEGMGYVIPSAIFQGFVGKEADPITRTLPSGEKEYLAYAKKYYDMFQIDVTSRIIDGFSVMGANAMEVYNQLSPKGSFVQNSTAGAYDIKTYKGVPYMRMFGVGGATMEDRCSSMLEQQAHSPYHFMPFEMTTTDNYATPSGIKEYVDAYEQYVKEHDPGFKVEYVDVNTFLDLVRQSGEGVPVEPIA